MAKRGVILVEWNGEQRAFQVLSDESMVAQYPATELVSNQNNFDQRRNEDNQPVDQELRKLIKRFEGCFEDRGVSAVSAEMQTLRTRILTDILGTRTPLRWLPAFLHKWQGLLRSMDTAPSDVVDFCKELTALAEGWKLIGDIAQARSVLSNCFQVTRRHLKVPFAKALAFEDGESQRLRSVAIIAKKLLLNCVASQTSLTRCKELILRQEAPPHVRASTTKELWMLFRQAPLAVELAHLLAQSLMTQRQFALITRFLEHSPFAAECAELTLMHARALGYMGFYRQSIQVAHVPESKEDTASTKALRAHYDCLTTILTCREQADEWLRLDRFEKAESSYDECLALVDPADHKLTAALLFGRANALLGQERLSAAIKDLRKCLQLDPANKLASIRLNTACLQLETERIKNELSGNRPGVKLRSRGSR